MWVGILEEDRKQSPAAFGFLPLNTSERTKQKPILLCQHACARACGWSTCSISKMDTTL